MLFSSVNRLRVPVHVCAPRLRMTSLMMRRTAGTGATTTTNSFSTLRLNQIPVTGANTKVVCTVGPASDSTEPFAGLVDNGMSVARLNFSHSGTDYSYAEQNLALVRNAHGKHHQLLTGSGTHAMESASSSAGDDEEPLRLLPNNLRAVLVDTKGPEIRTGILPGNVDVMEIPEGATVILTTSDVSEEPIPDADATELKLMVDYQSIAKTLNPGCQVLLDDGLIALEVQSSDPATGTVTTMALNGGPIKKNKGVNLPGVELDLPALTDKDKRDLEWAVANGADFVAASFIRTPAHVRSVVAFLDRCVAHQNKRQSSNNACTSTPDDGSQHPAPSEAMRPLVISKIESKEGVDNFNDILKESDGIMVARGDLGVEIPYSKVFAAQRMMVKKCNDVGKPVIVATQMLDSMTRNPRPTRAEVTDVGTAVMDGADAVMLSGETAAGKYPVESVKAMTSIVWEADQIINESGGLVWNEELHQQLDATEQELDAVAASAVRSARDMGAKMIVLITMSGRVARAVARHRPTVPVLCFCTNEQVARRLQLHRSIIPIMLQTDCDPSDSATRMGFLRAETVRTAKELAFLQSGDRIVMVDRTVGRSHDMHELSHNMKVVTLRDS